MPVLPGAQYARTFVPRAEAPRCLRTVWIDPAHPVSATVVGGGGPQRVGARREVAGVGAALDEDGAAEPERVDDRCARRLRSPTSNTARTPELASALATPNEVSSPNSAVVRIGSSASESRGPRTCARSPTFTALGPRRTGSSAMREDHDTHHARARGHGRVRARDPAADVDRQLVAGGATGRARTHPTSARSRAHAAPARRRCSRARSRTRARRRR